MLKADPPTQDAGSLVASLVATALSEKPSGARSDTSGS